MGDGSGGVALTCTDGSPPRAWGARRLPLLQHGQHRFTPTCVGSARPGSSRGQWAPVHPHVRGERNWSRTRRRPVSGSPPRAWGARTGPGGSWLGSGSPPRAWGAHGRRPAQGRLRRFTPTCVGSTRRPRADGGRPAVHPHVRGEHGARTPARAGPAGSPPRAWGARLPAVFDRFRHRFTPTCVGSTRPPASARPIAPVHPHVRGEHVIPAAAPWLDSGSPPRAWGALHDRGADRGPDRFTPTCVGSTPTPRGRPRPAPVHPHVRGEHFGRLRAISWAHGSPPRAWGAHIPILVNDRLTRFTPTCVGSTSGSRDHRGRPPVHPHVRGEHRLRSSAAAGNCGSPPRAWGARHAVVAVAMTARFTPTCVGSTLPGEAEGTDDTVHPHVRGEHWPGAYGATRIDGSPPRAWGAHRERLADEPIGRFTPTCVGSTFKWPPTTVGATVHPHVRGEHVAIQQRIKELHGSPPRAWGARSSIAARHR